MKNIIRVALPATMLVWAAAASAQSLVNFVWKPLIQTVPIGSFVTVELWAVPGTQESTNISGFEAVIAWNTTALDFIEYTPFAQPNNTFIEGNGNGDMSLFDFTPSFSVLAAGLQLGNFKFKATAVGTTEIAMLGDGTIQSPSGDFGGQTIVYRLQSDGGNFVPDYSSRARITISPVPEPGVLIGLGVGLLALLRRRA